MPVTRLFYRATFILRARPPFQAPSPGSGGRRPAPGTAPRTRRGRGARAPGLAPPSRPPCSVRRWGPATSAGPHGRGRPGRRAGRPPRSARTGSPSRPPDVRRRAGRTPCSSPAMGIRRSTGSHSCSPGPRGGGGAATNLAPYPDLANGTCSATGSPGDVARVRPPSNGTRYPGRPVSTSRYAPGTAVLDPGTGGRGPPGRGTLSELALLPPPTMSRSPVAPGRTSPGAPRYTRDMPLAPPGRRGSPRARAPRTGTPRLGTTRCCW